MEFEYEESHQIWQGGYMVSNFNNTARKTKNCWKFNKGKCNDTNCKFPHKCNYCDGRHGIYTCYKKDRRAGPSSDKMDTERKDK